MTARLLAVVTAAWLPAQTPTIAAPSFSEGSVASLSCRVLDVDEIDKYGRLLTVEVHNEGKLHAEPLEFLIEAPASNRQKRQKSKAPATERFLRVLMPRVARYGRPTPPAGKQRYVLRTHLLAKKARYRVTVTTASFHDECALSQPEFKIGKPEQVQRKSLAGVFPVTKVALHNPLDRPVDVLLRVTLRQPLNGVELMGARLPANDTLDWVITHRGGTTPYVDPDVPPGTAFKAVKFEVVDWSVVGHPAPQAGTKLLQPAYRAWYRWPETDPVVTGSFRFRERRQKFGSTTEYDDVQSTGRITRSAGGKVEIAYATGAGADPSLLLLSVLADLVRPSFDELQAENKLVPVTADRIAVCGPGWHASGLRNLSIGGGRRPETFNDLRVVAGRITDSGTGDETRTTWQTQAMGAHYVVTRRRDASNETSYAFVEQGGRLVPSTIARTTTYGDRVYSSSELVLTDLRFDGRDRVEPPKPSGAGVAALRSMWDAAYRMPSAPVELAARFEVNNPGNDELWRGEKRIKGQVRMRGIGRFMQDADFTFDGKLSPDVQLALAAVIRDRLLMWYSRDFNCRPTFDDFFGGAEIHDKATNGEFRIDGCQCSRVLTKDGVIRGFLWATGGTTLFKTVRVGAHDAVTEIRQDNDWRSTVLVGLTPVSDYLLPTTLKFERIFGKRWGPETLTFKQWKQQ